MIDIQNVDNLLTRLNSLLIDYYALTIQLRNVVRKLKETINAEKLLARKEDLERRIDSTLAMISDIYDQLDEYFNNGYFSEIDEETAKGISDEYIEIINNMDPINFMASLPTMKKFPDILDKNRYLQNEFKKLSNNIEVYNTVAKRENWSFSIIDPEEALKYYKNMRSHIAEDFNRFKKCLKK